MKILVVDDNEAFRVMLGTQLQQLGHQIQLEDDGIGAAAALAESDFDVLISDWLMPGMDGPSLCRAVRADPARKHIYIILITSMNGLHDYRDGIDAGADDFINKPFDPEHLEARLHAAARILALHRELRDQALVDRLTGLLNRGAILDALEQELSRAGREARGLAVYMVDIDHFKQVNDRYGHPAGDSVLQETARRMQRSFRPYDRVGRYGGEEFLLVAPCADAEHAEKLGQRIRRVIAARPVNAGDLEIPVTVSVGVLAIHADPFPGIQELIGVADAALYRAKNGGRNRVELVDCYARPAARRRRSGC